jgi:hypothetical protein
VIHFPVVVRRDLVFLFVAFLIATGFATVAGAATYTWNVNGTASWNTASNWTPARTTPATNDVLVFDGALTPAPEATGIGTQTIGRLVLTNNVFLKLRSAGPGFNTLTLSGGPGTDLDVPVGSTLGSSFGMPAPPLSIALNSGATGTMAGRLEWFGQMLPGGAGALTVSGTFTGNAGPNSQFGTTVLNGVVFQSGSVYEYSGSDPFGAAAPASVSVFQTGSKFRVASATNTLPLSGRTISKLEFDPGSDQTTTTVSGSGTLTVDDIKSFTGHLKIQLPLVLIRGNTLSHYQTLEFQSGTVVEMQGTVPQTMQGTVLFPANTELRITNPSGVTLTTDSTQINGILRLSGGDLTLPAPGPFLAFYVFGRLDLIQGRVHTGTNTIRLPSPATLTGGNASSYIDGTVFLGNPSASSATVLLPIGDANRYAPVTIQYPGIGTAPAITASTTAGDHANIGTAPLNASRSVNRTWTLDSGPIPASTVTFGFDPADLDPNVNTAALVVGRYGPFGAWSTETPGTRTATSTQATGVTYLSEFQVAEPTYTITASAGAGGSIAPSGLVTLPYGGSQSYSITPLTGYVILDVLVDGVSQGPISSYSFTNVTASHTIQASFQPFFTITASAGAGGQITPAGVTTLYGAGNSQAYTITPNAGFVIQNVVVDGVSQGAIGTYTFTNVSTSHTIAATFIATYTITASAGPGGTIVPNGVSTVVSGASKSYTITPNAGYALLSLVIDGVPITPVTTFVFSNVTANHTIDATFTPLYMITASAGAGGTIAPSGTTTLPAGSNQSYTITPNAGYVILQVLVDGVAQGPVASYSFNNLAASHTISATFQQVFTITAGSGPGGTVTPPGATVVNSGTNQSYAITPNAGFIILQVQVDGVSQGAISAYTFNNVVANHTISATFQQVFTITATAGAGGTISPAGVTTKNAGASQSYTITPGAGKAVLDVLVDGASVGAVASYTFTNLSANHTIDATFKSVFTIDATAGIGGTITPSGLLTGDAGSTQAFTITPNPGYSVNQVLVDGASQGAITSYSFPNLSASHTIYASFTTIHAIVASAGSGEFTAIPGFNTPVRASGIAVGDLNGDGRQDLVMTGENTISAWLGNGAGGFGMPTTFPTDQGPRAPILADFNRDNRLDVAVPCQNSSVVSLFYGNGSGGFVQGPKLYAGGQPLEVVAADLNGDGRLDFAIANSNSAWLAIHMATGPNTYAFVSEPAVVRYTTSIAAGDINGDGKVDLVATNPSYGLASVLLNDGSGGFLPHIDYAAGYGARSGRLADFNNDGKLDLVSVDYGWYGHMYAMLGDGLGGFGPYTDYSVSVGPNDLAIGDLNADGNKDVVVVNYAAGGWSLSLLYGNGTGGFPVRKDMSANTNNAGAALADFNGDGVLDIATPSAANYSMYLFSGSGGSIAPSGTTAAVPGSNVAYTITPAAGFSIADVRVDGVSQGPLTNYAFNNVTSGHTIAASFTSPSAPLMVGGVPNSAEGGASLSLDGSTLVVSDIGASGDDGVSFGAEDAKTGLGVEFDGGVPVDPLVDTGATLELTLEGADANSPLGSVETTVDGDGLDIQADFTPIGAADQTVEVWDDSVRVLSMVVPNGETVHRDFDAASAAQRQPGLNRALAAGDGIEGVQVGLKKKPGGQLLGATQKFTMSRSTTVAGVTVAGNEIRFSALAQQPLVVSGSKLKAKSPGAGSHLAQLRISDQPAFASVPGVAAGGIVATPNGAAQIAAAGDDWQITGLGASGNDGADIDLSVASGAAIEFGAGSGFQIPRDAGAQLVHRVRGTIGAHADTTIGTVTETAWDDSITLRSDFRPLGATSQTIEILNGSTVVYSATHGLDEAVRVVAPLTGPGFRAQAASINTSRSNLKDKASLAAPGSSGRPTLEWAWGPANGTFDLMIAGTRVTGHVVRFRPNDGAAIKSFTTAELFQKNPGVAELGTLALRPVGIVAGADGSALRASGGAQVISTDHDKVRLLGAGGALAPGSAVTIASSAPSPRVAARPVLIENTISLLDSEFVIFTGRGRTTQASDVSTFPVAAIRNGVGFDLGPSPDSAGTSTYLTEVFSGGSIVASLTSTSPVVQCDAIPDQVEHRAAGPTFEGRWDTPRTLTVAGGPVVTGDRVRIQRIGSPQQFLSLDALTVDAGGMTAIDFSDVDTTGVTGVAPPRASGVALLLSRNPMRATDDARFGVTLPTPQLVRLELFDIAGRRVATLHDGPMVAGTTWVPWASANTGQHSGVLFVRLRAASGERIQKFTYLR